MFRYKNKFDYKNYNDDYWNINYKKLIDNYLHIGYRSKFCYILKISIIKRDYEDNKNKYKVKKKFKKEFLELLDLDVNKQYYIINIYNIIVYSLKKDYVNRITIDNKHKLYSYYKKYLNDNYSKNRQIYFIYKDYLNNFINQQIDTTNTNKIVTNKDFNFNDIGEKITKLII